MPRAALRKVPAVGAWDWRKERFAEGGEILSVLKLLAMRLGRVVRNGCESVVEERRP